MPTSLQVARPIPIELRHDRRLGLEEPPRRMPSPHRASSSGHETPHVLDDRQRGVLERLSEAEHAGILALPTDDPLDAKRRRRVDATYGEMMAQPDAVRSTWDVNAGSLGAVAQAIAERRLERAFLVGAGDSLAVMLAGRLAL